MGFIPKEPSSQVRPDVPGGLPPREASSRSSLLPDSGGDDPVSPRPSVQPQMSGKSQDGSTKTSEEAYVEHGFEDLRLGKDLDEEVSQQPDGGLPVDANDQQVDGQTIIEFCSRLFNELPAPLLSTPESPPPQAPLPRTGKLRKRKALQATHSNLRQVAKPSVVPVVECAQHKLMRELEFLNPQHPVPDAAVTEYIDLYGADLPK